MRVRAFRLAVLAAAVAVASCAPAPQPEAERLVPLGVIDLPPMKTFDAPQVQSPRRSNATIARDFLDLSFRLESGREMERFTRFEGPVTVRVVGPGPASLGRDLDAVLARLRDEAGIDIARVSAERPASITIETVSRDEMRRAVPQAACFVVPRTASWDEFRRNRRSPALDWTTLTVRERMAIFIPRDVAPQEIRDCIHEELAQALGPLNDLYRLTDSVFNDDNFHTVLTGFDMLVLRATYAPELANGMNRDEVAARLPAVLTRLNPGGDRGGDAGPDPTTRDWIDAIEGALGPQAPARKRVASARRAVEIASRRGWRDNRLAFSLFALGRLSLPDDPDVALAAFLHAAQLYQSRPDTQLHAAHVAMQMAAYALSAGDAGQAMDIVDAHLAPVAEAENAALLATLLMVKAEALEQLDRAGEAQAVRAESLGWARYGFGSDAEVRTRATEIHALAGSART